MDLSEIFARNLCNDNNFQEGTIFCESQQCIEQHKKYLILLWKKTYHIRHKACSRAQLMKKAPAEHII